MDERRYAIKKWTGNPGILMLWILFSMWRFYRWTDKDAPWPKIEKKCHHIQSNKCILVHKVENLWDWKRPIFHKLQKRLSENATLVLYLDSSETKRVGILYEIVPIIFIFLFDFSSIIDVLLNKCLNLYQLWQSTSSQHAYYLLLYMFWSI